MKKSVAEFLIDNQFSLGVICGVFFAYLPVLGVFIILALLIARHWASALLVQDDEDFRAALEAADGAVL